MADESTRGKILMLCTPLVFVPSVLVSVGSMSAWLTALGIGTFVLSEVGAICFFFPKQTVYRWFDRRDHRAALASGRLRTEDVNRLLMRYRGPEVSHQVQHHLLALLPRKAHHDTAYGLIARDWMRRRGDLALLDDALTANLPPTVLRAHLDGTTPLDPVAVATLAALVRGVDPDDNNDGDVDRFTLFSMAATSTRSRGAASPHCGCGVAHT